METETPTPTPVENPQTETVVPAPQVTIPPSTEPQGLTKAQKIGIIAVLVLIIAGVIFAVVKLIQADAETTTRIRDIFIIFMALESILLGGAMVILMVQMATLINLLQNEIKPILDSTNETVNHLRGTTAFLSNNLVEPVMKLNEYIAGLKKIMEIFRIK